MDQPAAAQTVWQISEDLRVEELRPGVWMHTTWQTFDGTLFPSNGLIVRDGDGLLLIDTAWGEEPTEALLAWIDETLGLPVVRAVGTHFHADRIGGAAVLERRGIPLQAHPLTRELALADGVPAPEAIAELAEVGSVVRVGGAEVFYPGPGHTRDNVMVWLPEAGVLFGGCAVRPADTSSRGNVSDADTVSWPLAIERAEQRYDAATVVVPSHGDPGGPDLLRHTRSLFTQ